ncbi:MAG: MotA/TolQ/ExbB proton channel family protein [Candidatus Omnitrophica bacterium]|nr:MotA/TolQ/ExbB proton channel family protein [Candidatus Omnitrophota bacterium]
MKKITWNAFFVFSLSLTWVFSALPAAAQENSQAASAGMTLWQVIQSGGAVMIVLGLLSLVMMSLVIFMFLRFQSEKLIPIENTRRVIELLRQKRMDEVKKLSEKEETMTASIVRAGLKAGSNSALAREAVEMQARKEVSGLWTLLNYLSEIAQIAPMLGLLGTVLGMIQAFNTIAFDSGVVKPIMLAGGVAKAMITTAGGLTIAILAMIFYSMLRPRAQNITNLLETSASQISEGFSA